MDNGAELGHQGEATDAAHDDSGGASEAAAALACNCCRRRKLRCSREVPNCQQCRKTGSECVYESKRSKPGMKAGAIENLHRRLDALERTVHQQRANPPDRRQSGSDTSPNRDTPGSTTDLEKNAYNIMSFFAKELQKFNAKSSGPISGAHLQGGDDQLPRTKRRRLENHDEAYPSRGSNMLVLPEEEILQVVFQAYFSHVHPWIPILHEATFRRRLAEPHDFEALRVVLHAMVLAGSRYIADEDTATTAFGNPQQRVMARDWVVSQAMKHLTVESLQALIIIAFNDIGSGEAAQAWSLVGSLTRTVEYLQLTIEHDDAERLSLSQPFVSLPPPDNWTEAEERRRVFWNVFKLDRLISVTMGWNTSLTSDDVHCRLPCDGVLWRKEDRVVTPYFGIWDKAAGRIGNPIAFIPSHYAQTSQITTEEETQTPSEAGTSPGAQIPSVDMSTVGAFAYCIEATESLSRVTSYFLQQKVNMRDQRDISSWLTRFKELDLRLVHWKMLLPQKWKANMARQSTRMDPNLTLAHVTHNTSMILLHQLIAFPPREWAFRARLPSILSIDTCQAAAVEIAIIAENYLKHAPPTMPVSSQFAFCIYVAARVLLLRWKYDLGGELVPEFWSLVQILDEMAGRWAGPHSLEPARDNLAGKYSRKLTEMHSRCREDASYNINVLGYTTEIDHTSSKDPPVFPQPARNGIINPNASNQRSNTARIDPNLLPATEPRQGMAPNTDSIVVAQQFAPPVVNPNPNSGGIVVHSGMEMNGVETMTQSNVFHRSSVGSGELSSISQMLLDQQFVDMDRIISFDDGIFGTEYEGGGW
ncbi:putative transcriptional regulatory protein [Colletotrichum siamense]|uniref:Transcriptional regulatory protein n=1 Tax=Colletotrichum siamense TaxID=690259 RepID=A0A9P5BR61_COLSI|nr:putative transcriptional regulatory protein [Colletotrichum siamense]KAF4849844.1 putative transcriptional regulatory protein [Colletotrichum siamense]